MELLVASAIGILTAAGLYLVLRLRTFPVIMGMSLLTYAVNVFLFASGRLTTGAPPILTDAQRYPKIDRVWSLISKSARSLINNFTPTPA